jgi:arabinogalactan oligomer/maltooligosaccharide transport system substrate-binding protein
MTKISSACSLIFVLVLAVSAGACQSGESPAASNSATRTATEPPEQTATPSPSITPEAVTGTVSIWHSWEDAYVPALLQRIYAFNQVYPSVYFDVQYVPALDLRAAFEQASQDGRAPKLLLGQSEWGSDLYDKGWVIDLANLLSADLLNSLNPAAVSASRYHDVLFAAPVDIRGVVLYRNQSIIPIAPSTFDELVSLAKEYSRGQIVGAMLDRSFFFSGAHLTSLGGSLMDANGMPAFNNLKGLEWMTLLQTFSQAGPTEFFSENDSDLFKEGRVGMIVDGTWNRNDLADAVGLQNLAIDPWPIHAQGSLSGFVQSESLYLTPQALKEDHQVSLRFLQYFLSSESQAAVVATGLIPAINGSPVSLAANQIRVKDPLIAQAMLALTGGVANPVGPLASIYASQMDIALRSVFERSVPPEEALLHADEAIRAALVTPTP